MSTNIPWPDEDIARLRELHATGRSFRLIAGDLGYTRNAIIGKVHRLKLPPRPRPPCTGRKRKPRGLPRVLRVMAPRPVVVPRPVGPFVHLRAHAPLEASIKRVPFAGLDGKNCHWPLGSPKEPAEWFCGDAAARGLSYCPAHYCIAYTPSNRGAR